MQQERVILIMEIERLLTTASVGILRAIYGLLKS